MNSFSHSGDLGDLIYGLPTIRALGGGELWIHADQRTRVRMTAERVPSISEFLEQLPYISKCVWNPSEAQFNLDLWRKNCYTAGLNIAEMHLKAFSLPFQHQGAPWIQIEGIKKTEVIINRTRRWRNEDFPWKRVVELYGRNIGFVGTEDERREFTGRFGHVRHIKTDTLLMLAKVISGCTLFIGNQSAPLAIAEGMHKRVIQEAHVRRANCQFKREGSFSYMHGDLSLPKI